MKLLRPVTITDAIAKAKAINPEALKRTVYHQLKTVL